MREVLLGLEGLLEAAATTSKPRRVRISMNEEAAEVRTMVSVGSERPRSGI